MGVNQNGNKGDRQTQEESKPDIDISPEIKTKRLPRCREKLVNLFRDINSHTRLVRKVEIAGNYRHRSYSPIITYELPGVTGILTRIPPQAYSIGSFEC